MVWYLFIFTVPVLIAAWWGVWSAVIQPEMKSMRMLQQHEPIKPRPTAADIRRQLFAGNAANDGVPVPQM